MGCYASKNNNKNLTKKSQVFGGMTDICDEQQVKIIEGDIYDHLSDSQKVGLGYISWLVTVYHQGLLLENLGVDKELRPDVKLGLNTKSIEKVFKSMDLSLFKRVESEEKGCVDLIAESLRLFGKEKYKKNVQKHNGSDSKFIEDIREMIKHKDDAYGFTVPSGSLLVKDKFVDLDKVSRCIPDKHKAPAGLHARWFDPRKEK